MCCCCTIGICVLSKGKSYDITYVQIQFASPRPESFVIYKRACKTCEWTPYQFYSSNCEHKYGLANNEAVTSANEAVALCSEDSSDIVPLTGGKVAFSTLEGRPNAYNFESNEALKEWVTATDIRISLERLNTFGDEVFGDSKVLRSYYYAISDISIGAKCKCNGHADQCERFHDDDHDDHANLDDKARCKCMHNTDGPDCDRCLPFYNDAPWAAATLLAGNECKSKIYERTCNKRGIELRLQNRGFLDQILMSLLYLSHNAI